MGKMSKSTVLMSFRLICVLGPNLGLFSTEEYDDTAACFPRGDKNRENQTGVICWVSEGQSGSLEENNDL